jgi:hypothetical protein
LPRSQQRNRNAILALAIATIVLIIITIGAWPWISQRLATARSASFSKQTIEPTATESRPTFTPASGLTAAASKGSLAAGTPFPTITNVPPTPVATVATLDREAVIAAPGFTRVFTHTFEDGDAWDDNAGGDWQVIDDGTGNHVYQVQASAAHPYSASAPPEQEMMGAWTDYALDLRLRILQQGAGDDDLAEGWITIRDDSDPQDCAMYSFQFNFRQQKVAMDTNDHCQYKLLEEKPFPFERKRWYNIRVEAVGTHLKLLIDGRVIINREDATAKRGFYYLTADKNAVLQFDDIRVEQYSP